MTLPPIALRLHAVLVLRLIAAVALTLLTGVACRVAIRWEETVGVRSLVDELHRARLPVHLNEQGHDALDRSIPAMASCVAACTSLACLSACTLWARWPLRGRVRLGDADMPFTRLDHRAFVLCVRAIGLLLVGFGLPRLIGLGNEVGPLIEDTWWLNQQGQVRRVVLLVPLMLVGYLGQLAIGLYLLFWGHRLIRFCLRDATSRCPCCAYDLSGCEAQACPECGFGVRQ